jgi:hypothetical protein
MSWVSAIVGIISMLSKMTALLHDRQLIDAGEAKAIADSLKVANDRIGQAIAARERARASGPDPNDPYLRD